MIKKLFAILLVMTLISSLGVAVLAESDGYDVLRFESDFDDYTAGTPANWKLNNGSTIEPYVEENGNTAVAMENWKTETSTGSGKGFYTNIDTSNPYTNVKVEFKFMKDEDNDVSIMYVKGDAANSANSVTLISIPESGTMTLKSKDAEGVSNDVNLGTMTNGEWHQFVIYIDFVTANVKVIYDGEQVANGYNGIVDAHDYLTSIRFYNNGVEEGLVKYMYIDNFKMYVPAALTASKSYPADGSENFPRKGGIIEFETSRKLYAFDDTSVILKDGEGEVVEDALTVTRGEQTVAAKVTATLEPSSKYTIEFLGKKYSIKTAASEIVADLPALEDLENGTYKATVTVTNTGDTPKDATLVVASYYADTNQMYDYDFSSASVSETPVPLSQTVEVPDGEFYVLSFIVDDMTNFNLLREDFAGANEFSLSGKGKSALEIKNIQPSGDNVIIDAAAADKGERTVIVKVTKRAEESEEAELMAVAEPIVDFIAPVKTNEDGKLYFTFAPKCGNGWYDFQFIGNTISASQTSELYFISLDTQNEIKDAVNDAVAIKNNTEESDDIETILGTDYKTELNLDEKYFTENAYTTVFEQKPYETYNEVTATMIAAYDVIKGLNEQTWSSLTEYIEENEVILMHDNDDYEYYKKLSSNKKNTINKSLIKDFASFKEFRAAFSKAIKDYKTKLSQALNNQIQGGGGNTGDNNVQMPVTGGGAAPTTPVTPAVPQPLFSDLGGAVWAETPIIFLANKGIISGDGNGSFRPLDNVSREEFVKMIVNVFGISAVADNGAFTDASADAWYTPYLAAAKKAGIVQGRADGSFGIGEKITRQDMAVMLYRAINAANKELQSGDGADFADASAFAGYATEAITKLQSAGLISGVGEGKFAPNDMANRAQAAQIIYNLFNKEVVK